MLRHTGSDWIIVFSLLDNEKLVPEQNLGVQGKVGTVDNSKNWQGDSCKDWCVSASQHWMGSCVTPLCCTLSKWETTNTADTAYYSNNWKAQAERKLNCSPPEKLNRSTRILYIRDWHREVPQQMLSLTFPRAKAQYMFHLAFPRRVDSLQLSTE